MTHTLRVLLLRRLNQAFWLLILMGLATWGAWRFSKLATQSPAVTRPVIAMNKEFQQVHLQSISSLDSSVTMLHMAVMAGQPETTLLNLTEQLRQQTQEVSLLSVSGQSAVSEKLSASQTQLIDQCLTFRQLLARRASIRLLSQHIATWQSQVRHLQYRVASNS